MRAKFPARWVGHSSLAGRPLRGVQAYSTLFGARGSHPRHLAPGDDRSGARRLRLWVWTCLVLWEMVRDGEVGGVAGMTADILAWEFSEDIYRRYTADILRT